MTIEATPVIEAQSTTVVVSDADIQSPKQGDPVYYGKPILARQRAVVASAGHEIWVEWVFRDQYGNPVDLNGLQIGCVPDPCDLESLSSSLSSSSFSSSSMSSSSAAEECNKVMFRFREILNFSGTQPTYECEGEVVNAGAGEVKVFMDNKELCPGVYWAEMAVVDPAGCPLLSNVFRLVIERSLWAMLNPGQPLLQNGPPTLAEIRLHLRDSSPEESLLLDHIRFDDAEMALAIVRPIEYWNEIPPPLKHHTTSSFPHRFHWMDAIAANLFFMVEEQFRANNLSYSAAGVQVNDQDKEQNYARAGERRWANWKEFVKRKKAQENLDGCWGAVASSYSYTGYGSGRSF